MPSTYRTFSEYLAGVVHAAILVVLFLFLVLEERILGRVEVFRLLLDAGT